MIEIERRWLLKKFPHSISFIKTTNIVQYYVDGINGTIRYRKSFNDTNTIEFEKIIKTNLDYGVNNEEHFDITEEEFNQNHTFTQIHKIRHTYIHKNLNFELDLFLNRNLILMEVELEDINQKITIPKEIQNCIIIEVTGMKEFSNYELAKP